MPAERRFFLSSLEPVVYLDSTYTIAYFDTTERFHEECNAFRQRLETGSVLCFVSLVRCHWFYRRTRMSYLFYPRASIKSVVSFYSYILYHKVCNGK